MYKLIKFITSLRAEIVFSITLLMIAATALIGFVVLKVSEQAAFDQKDKSARVILNSIQNSLRFADAEPGPADVSSIQRLIDVFMGGGGISAIMVVDRDMRIVAHSSRSEVGKLHPEDALARAIKGGDVTSDISGSFVTVTSPLFLQDALFGGIKITLSSSDIRNVAGKSQRLILFYVILNSVILIVFASVLLSRRIVRPIDELVRVTEAIAGGDMDQRIKVKRLNEIGMLAESLNRMAGKLREGRDVLEDNIRTLKAAHDDLRKAQDEVIRAEKMASVGRLAAGLAHEIGNPVGAIIGYTNILQKEANGEDQADYLARIEMEVQRINRIVRGLLDYARPGEFKPTEVSVNEIIKSSLDLVSSQKGFERIEVKTHLTDTPMAKADPHQLQQVLINLFINASDAMPEGGHLTVESGVRRQESGEFLEISVADTGTGMDDEDTKKIFDPFYTTKEPGKGTGLGLAICQRIIESFGGKIEVTSRKGEGSKFKIILPARREAE